MRLSTQTKNIILIIAIVLIVLFAYFHFLPPTASQTKQMTSVSPTVTQTQTITYPGVNGKDALTLLKDHASVKQDASGMVVSINNVKADNTKHTYWEFFINGKSSDVGAAQYMTKNGDTLIWKIAKY